MLAVCDVIKFPTPHKKLALFWKKPLSDITHCRYFTSLWTLP